MSASGFFLVVLMCVVIQGCADKPADRAASASTTPFIELYKKEGIEKFDCSFPMTEGHHNLKNIRGCTNDDDYYFIIDNPRDGVMFTLTDDPSCNFDKGPWARYLIRDPDYGVPTKILGVEAGFFVPSPGLVELVRGIYATGHDSFGGKKLAGKVSCVRIYYMRGDERDAKELNQGT